jgi:type III pantothenate kinase
MNSKSPLVLLIDAGNTRIKWACMEQSATLTLPVQWTQLGSVAHQDVEHLRDAWSDLDVLEIVVSNVAGEKLGKTLSQVLASQFPEISVQIFRSQAHYAGVQNQYQEPQRLGADRFASAIAAHYLYPDLALVVATCGTATTVDAVDGAEFVGGMILPGLQLMAASLAKNTAQLPQIAESLGLQDTFAKNTDQAIVSGCLHAQVGAMLGAVEKLRHRSSRPVQLLISGGAAPFIIPQLKLQTNLIWHHVENLVLAGLFVANKLKSTAQSSTPHF